MNTLENTLESWHRDEAADAKPHSVRRVHAEHIRMHAFFMDGGMEKIAAPGELVATSEEYAASSGTLEEEGGIYALTLGEVQTDSRRRTISVQPKRRVRMLREGDVVIARVESIYSSMALTKIERVLEREGERVAFGDASAFLRISELGFYAPEFRDALKVGDVLRARVIEISPLATRVTIASDDLGVVKAFCSNCRRELKREGAALWCEACGSREQRKLAGAAPPGAPRVGRERRFPEERFEERPGRRFERRERRERVFEARRVPRRGPRRKKIYGPWISKNY